MVERLKSNIFSLHMTSLMLQNVLLLHDTCFWVHINHSCFTMICPHIHKHHQTDEQREIVNKWLEGYLKNYVTGKQRAWVKWLHIGEERFIM